MSTLEPSDPHKVTAIVPCYNEEAHIEELVQELLRQDLAQEELELLFIDGMSEDRTPEILASYAADHPSIRVLKNEDRYVPHALNKGIREAKGDLIMILGAHASYPDHYIRHLSERLIQSGADCVGAPAVTDTLNKTTKSDTIKKVLAHPFGVGNSMFRIGIDEEREVDTVPFGCYLKQSLIDIGGYNEALTRNQDIELNKRLVRAGGRILLVPDIECKYYARDTYKALARNNFMNGLWIPLTLYITKDTSSLSIRHFIPLCFVLSLVLPLIAGIFMPVLLLLPPLILAFYFLVIFIVSVRDRSERTSLPRMLIAFFILHFSYGGGSLLGLFRFDKLASSGKHPLDQNG
ncbi:MAG: glycosyltransferase family 2 protein [Flavobacteriales bacterium]